jgi:basic membrane protein A
MVAQFCRFGSGVKTFMQGRPSPIVLMVLATLLSTMVAQAAPVRVALVLDKGGRDDKSFNAAAYRGATEAEKKFGIKLKTVEATDDNAFEPMLKSLAQKDFDLIVAVGISQAEAVKKVAPQFTNKHFAIVDAEISAPNVRSLLFQEHEGSFLVGAIAAMTSKTGKIGFIGGLDIPLIRPFELGYSAGAKQVNPKVQVMSNFIGVTGDAWNNPPKAKELALSQFNRGGDVIFSAAGASTAGIFDAAEETKKFAIGVDSNQNWIKPGLVLTSMVKKVDSAVFASIEQSVQGKFTAGVIRHGLSNQGIDFAVDQYNEKVLTPEVRKKAEQLKAQIVAGKIKVPDFYQSRK